MVMEDEAAPLFIPPLEPEELQEAYKIASEADYQDWEQTQEAVEKALAGFWDMKPLERMQFYDLHEPLMVVNVLGQQVYSPYWQTLWDIDPQETEKMIRDWKGIATEREKKESDLPVY